MKSVLYISYDGMLEPLGQSQVMAYLLRLAQDTKIHLISFEKADDWADVQARERVQRLMRQAGVVWHPLRYHKTPTAVATSWDILQGTAVGLALVWLHGLKLVHARSYVAAVMALGIKTLSGARFLFDMRGFWADERVDGGIWPRSSRMYRVAKWFERQFLCNADAVVSLTRAAVDDMKGFDYMKGRRQHYAVIPTCVDLELFSLKRTAPEALDAGSRGFVLGYVGSAGGWCLFDEAVRTFQSLSKVRPDATLMIVNRSEHAYIRERLAAFGVDLGKVTLVAAGHDEVVGYIHQMDACVFYYVNPVFSNRARAPTKLGELLACGVPCMTNGGVGDSEWVLRQGQAGVVLVGFGVNEVERGVEALLRLTHDPGVATRCREVAEAEFDLEVGVKRYRALYLSLAAADGDRARS